MYSIITAIREDADFLCAGPRRDEARKKEHSGVKLKEKRVKSKSSCKSTYINIHFMFVSFIWRATRKKTIIKKRERV